LISNVGADVTTTPTVSAPEPFGTFPPTRLQDLIRDIGGRLPKNWPGMRFSGWLNYLMQTTYRQPVDVVVLGQRMRLHLDNNSCERRLMVTPQFFDPEELAILRQCMRPDFQFVDLGANVGAYSVFVGTLAGPGARVLAVEPQEALLPRLRANIALNGLGVKVAPVAVGDREGTIEFAVDANNLGFTSVNTARRGRAAPRIIELPMRRLLGLVQEHGFERIDALKADIEGAEDLALLPFFDEAPRTLWPRLLIIENNSVEWRRDCISLLQERGYDLSHARTGNAILKFHDE
jgi:FkbM family methyltransferase